MRAITNKEVQVQEEHSCGYNCVYPDSFPIKWKELAKAGIKRKKDKKTGEPFLLLHMKINCDC